MEESPLLTLNSNQSKLHKSPFIRQRYVIGIMGFLALANASTQRYCISMAITEMVASPKLRHTNADKSLACQSGGSEDSTNEEIAPTNVTEGHESGEFEWDQATQGLILSVFFWGYVALQIPGGLLAEKFGGKYPVAVGLTASTIGTLLTPVVTRNLDATGLILIRILVGLGQGPVYPSINVLLSRWAPPRERGRLVTFVFTGAQIGCVLALAISGALICLSGWPTVFYVFGTSGLIWLVLWLILCYSNPSEDPFISQSELEFLNEELGSNIPTPTPWKAIFSSVPFWALVAVQIGHDWCLFISVVDLPSYLKCVLHLPVTKNGILSAIPYLAMWIFANIFGHIVDWLVGPKKVNVTFVRKLFMTIGWIGPAVGLLAGSYFESDTVLVVCSFSLGIGLMGAFVPSLKVNSLDLSPNHAGTVMALVGGTGSFAGAIAPYLVGILTPNNSLLEWRLVFVIAVAILVTTNIIYLIFGSAEEQPWNKPNPTEIDVNKIEYQFKYIKNYDVFSADLVNHNL